MARKSKTYMVDVFRTLGHCIEVEAKNLREMQTVLANKDVTAETFFRKPQEKLNNSLLHFYAIFAIIVAIKGR